MTCSSSKLNYTASKATIVKQRTPKPKLTARTPNLSKVTPPITASETSYIIFPFTPNTERELLIKDTPDKEEEFSIMYIPKRKKKLPTKKINTGNTQRAKGPRSEMIFEKETIPNGLANLKKGNLSKELAEQRQLQITKLNEKKDEEPIKEKIDEPADKKDHKNKETAKVKITRIIQKDIDEHQQKIEKYHARLLFCIFVFFLGIPLFAALYYSVKIKLKERAVKNIETFKDKATEFINANNNFIDIIPWQLRRSIPEFNSHHKCLTVIRELSQPLNYCTKYSRTN